MNASSIVLNYEKLGSDSLVIHVAVSIFCDNSLPTLLRIPRFIHKEDGQDFAEYVLILGAIETPRMARDGWIVRPKEKGQAMTEFALIMPVLILLLFGMTYAAFYAFRFASTDWGIFIAGVASGSYNTPATEHICDNVLWPDLADRSASGAVMIETFRGSQSVFCVNVVIGFVVNIAFKDAKM